MGRRGAHSIFSLLLLPSHTIPLHQHRLFMGWSPVRKICSGMGSFTPCHGACPPPLTLVFPLLFLTLHSLLLSPCGIFSPFKYGFTEVPPPWLLGLAVSFSGSVVELAELTGTSYVWHGTAVTCPYKGHPCSSPATKTLPWTPNIYIFVTASWKSCF